MHLRTVRSILGATALITAAIFAGGFVTAMGCGSSSNSDTSGGDSSTGDTNPADVRQDTRDARPDTRDAHLDTFEAGPDTNPEFDTHPGDIGPGDSSTLFACGTESCNTLLEFCLVDPGCDVTPPTDAGSDTGGGDAGDAEVSAPDTTPPGDTGACARHCETYADADASICLGFPSCSCVSGILCGSIDKASCDDSSGGVVISCKTP